MMRACLAATALRALADSAPGLIGQGKMLRARLALRVGPATGAAPIDTVRAAAAVELTHAASLLHDDVIDGGVLRRGAPAFWVEKGVSGAILLGDLLLFKALELVAAVDPATLLPALVRLTGEVCEAETEQELLLRGAPAGWEQCLRIARRKTGPLFAFAALAGAGADPRLARALEASGYEVGTAYQLADDLLDVAGDPALAGKTLGSDSARAKVTAAAAALNEPVDPPAVIRELCAISAARLVEWPAVQSAWQAYLDLDLRPAIDHNLTAVRGLG